MSLASHHALEGVRLAQAGSEAKHLGLTDGLQTNPAPEQPSIWKKLAKHSQS